MAENFLGYLGAEFHRPVQPGGEYRSVLRFDSLEHLEMFERSGFRQEMLDAALIHRLLGAFILLMIPARRSAAHHDMTIQRWHLLPLGAVMGLLSGVVGTVGPINAPFFLAYGLVKGAYLATEALGAAAVRLTKSAVYGRLAALDLETLT